MYLYVLSGTRRYTKIQGGTCWYNEQYKKIQDGMYWYVLVCTGMYQSLRFNQVMLPCGWIRCCNSALPIALYWRPVFLMTQ